MLVLSRHRSERIFIGEDVIITVVDIRGHQVRLGIEAPREISVQREEVHEEIEKKRWMDTQLRLAAEAKRHDI